MTDNVNHPKHYCSSNAKCSNCNHAIECIDVTRHLSFNLGNAIKYLWRYELKNGAEDLEKAIWYIKDEIKRLAKDSASQKPDDVDFEALRRQVFGDLPSFSPGDIVKIKRPQKYGMDITHTPGEPRE